MAWLHRAVLAGLLLAAYLWAWTPARTAWTTQGAALVERVLDAADATGSVSARPAAHTLRVQTGSDTTTGYTAPAGVKFLLPAGFLVIVAPGRPRLGTFFTGHLLLGGLGLALLVGEAAGLPGGLGLSRFVQTYGVDAYSLAVPVFVWARTRSVP
jgi:hypothetical protein